MHFKIHLLALKTFRPRPKLGRKGSDGLAPKWVCKMLQLLGLRMEHIAGAFIEAGTDIKGAFENAFRLEWFLPHFLNRVTPRTQCTENWWTSSRTLVSISINLMPLGWYIIGWRCKQVSSYRVKRFPITTLAAFTRECVVGVRSYFPLDRSDFDLSHIIPVVYVFPLRSVFKIISGRASCAPSRS